MLSVRLSVCLVPGASLYVVAAGWEMPDERGGRPNKTVTGVSGVWLVGG